MTGSANGSDFTLTSLRTAFKTEAQRVETPGLTKELLLAELQNPKYSVIRNESGIFVDGVRVCGLTALISGSHKWPSGTSMYANQSAGQRGQTVMSQLKLATMTVLREKTLNNAHKLTRTTILDCVSKLLPKLAPITVSKAYEFAACWLDKAHDGQPCSRLFCAAWSDVHMNTHMGSEVDTDVKAVLLKQEKAKYSCTTDVVFALLNAGLEPVAVDLNVTSSKTKGVDPHLCPDCKRCFGSVYKDVYGTEIDIVCFNKTTQRVCVVELKCTINPEPSKIAKCYHQTQSWLTWLMFSNTYPQLRAVSESVIISTSLMETGSAQIRPTIPKTHSHTATQDYPLISQWCKQGLQRLCPISPLQTVNPFTLSCLRKRERGLGSPIATYKLKDSSRRLYKRKIQKLFVELIREAN
ncbi:ORF84-like protein [Bufonid herpesvirus 1]|uniref:ORF84-like protein n=1 Tax=Bufonid herpesvirus 1 TaxID=2282206 RepID=UPI000EB660F7|nr:ORF84-like protein [Bufonid herpesvirus 1]AXF48549.1 ORF84-like protein [Bufonid herpesvirus 1]